jgi:tRNA threonylcarbamoyladenosine biosynthesis protein TsaE
MNHKAIKSIEEGELWVREHSEFWLKPTVVLLSGPMGAGKTQISQWILSQLGHTQVSSPTFAIHHLYSVGDRRVDHFDLYRLKSDADLESSGFWDVLAEGDNLVLIEWADRLPDSAYPRERDLLFLEIAVGINEERVLTWRYFPRL